MFMICHARVYCAARRLRGERDKRDVTRSIIRAVSLLACAGAEVYLSEVFTRGRVIWCSLIPTCAVGEWQRAQVEDRCR